MPSAGKPRRRRPRDRGHARVVPAAHVPLVDEPEQHALGEHRVGEVEPGELVLARARRHRQVLDEPVVERPVVLELQRADRVRDALDRVRLAVREVVDRVDAPGVAGARVRRVQDPVQHRVAQVDVGRGHVDLRAQHPRPSANSPRASARTGPGSPRPAARARGCSAGLGERAAVLADLVGRQVVHVGLAGLDQVDRPLVELLEVVRGVVEVLAPVEAQPAHVRLDGVDVLLLLLDRVGVVEAQVAAAAELVARCRS